eukprot:COSAG04_NODE_1031_length_8627_cov_10.660765_2_plen_47_part_00
MKLDESNQLTSFLFFFFFLMSSVKWHKWRSQAHSDSHGALAVNSSR